MTYCQTQVEEQCNWINQNIAKYYVLMYMPYKMMTLIVIDVLNLNMYLYASLTISYTE